MADKQLSYDFTNTIRDYNTVFQALLVKQPIFMAQVPILPSLASQNKIEWNDYRLTALSSAITTIATPTATTIVVADGTAFKAGDVCICRSSTGAYKAEQIQVTAVSTNTLTVTRLYGSTTTTDFVVGDILYPITNKDENSEASSTPNSEATANYNYTQIFDDSFALSRTAMLSGQYDSAGEPAMQAELHSYRLMSQINQALLYGAKVARSSSYAGTLGGVMSYVNATGGNIVAAGGASISKTDFSTLWQYIFSDGGAVGRFACVCAPNQAAKISGFNTAGTNPLVVKQSTDKTSGGYINQLLADFQPSTGDLSAAVIVEPSMATDQILVVNLDKIGLKYMTKPMLEDVTLPTQDGKTWRILTELSLEVRNPLHAHGVITGLAV